MSPLPPISVASITIGFISFSFTLAILLHAFWDAFLTIASAPQQVRDNLCTLRQGLYEEREFLRRVRRRQQGTRDPHVSESKTLYSDGGPTKVITDAVKDLIIEFKKYEQHFLIPLHDGEEKDLDWSFGATQEQYHCDFPRRIIWLASKAGIDRIGMQLQRVQTRRIAVQVTEAHFMMADMMTLVRSCDDRLYSIEQRLQMSRLG